jgi:guanylate kinase
VIVIVSGPGGVGKGTVVARVLELCPRIRLSRSWTTRPPRPGEPEDAYVFVDRDSFVQKAARGGFLEWTEFQGSGHLYGTPVVEDSAGGQVDHEPTPEVLVLEIDFDGARQVKQRHPDAVLIAVTAPSQQVQEARLRGRGDDERSVARRLEVGERELEQLVPIADHVVVNDEVDRSAREVAGIIRDRLGDR